MPAARKGTSAPRRKVAAMLLRQHASAARAGCGALEEKLALAFIARERGGPLELGAGLLEATELAEEIAAHAGQEVVGFERRRRGQLVDAFQPSSWTGQHPERDCAIELHDR